jgi:hypothetical protein
MADKNSRYTALTHRSHSAFYGCPPSQTENPQPDDGLSSRRDFRRQRLSLSAGSCQCIMASSGRSPSRGRTPGSISVQRYSLTWVTIKCHCGGPSDLWPIARRNIDTSSSPPRNLSRIVGQSFCDRSNFLRLFVEYRVFSWHCHAASGLRSDPWPNNPADEEKSATKGYRFAPEPSLTNSWASSRPTPMQSLRSTPKRWRMCKIFEHRSTALANALMIATPARAP